MHAHRVIHAIATPLRITAERTTPMFRRDRGRLRGDARSAGDPAMIRLGLGGFRREYDRCGWNGGDGHGHQIQLNRPALAGDLIGRGSNNQHRSIRLDKSQDAVDFMVGASRIPIGQFLKRLNDSMLKRCAPGALCGRKLLRMQYMQPAQYAMESSHI
jgi:hypothetical protein